MKHLSLLSLFLLVGVLQLSARQSDGRPMRTPEQIADTQTERLQRDLNLTEEQRNQVHALHLKYAMRRTGNETREQIVIRMDSMRAEMKDILTSEQFELFMQKRRETGPQRQTTVRMVQSKAPADTTTAQ